MSRISLWLTSYPLVPVNDRLAALHHYSFRIFLILCYRPASSADHDGAYHDFLEEVERICGKAPNPRPSGHMNAKLGRDVGNENIIGTSNNYGRLLTEMITRLGMRAWNTFFLKRKGRLGTWRGPNGVVCNQIDVVCSPPTTTVLDCGIVNNFLFDTDHQMPSTGRIAYSTTCKTARIALLEDMRGRKITIVQKAIEKGGRLIETQRVGFLRGRKSVSKDPTSGAYSKRATETAMTSYNDELYESIHPDRIASEQPTLAKWTIPPMLTAPLNGELIPKDLTTAHGKLLFKKGDSNDMNSFRPMSLISGVLEATTRALLDDKKKARGDREPNQIWVLNRIAEKSVEYNCPIYVAHVDNEKLSTASSESQYGQPLRGGVYIQS
ncbi:unnamed protein product [Haemonchus placei]|uniref:Uncharacterized protein n=1 Tax=Haemonchus placei TaxID=6290 RepID=A0A3P7VM85_HAEPC|nr:unnamed protein product [Haemonchus placei]